MPKIEAIIFDLDGTITKPILNFDAIRKEIGVESGPVWESIQKMEPEERRQAEKILVTREIEAAERAELNDGAEELFGKLSQTTIASAILTRNCLAAWNIVKNKFNLDVHAVYTREDGPLKPDPKPVVMLAKQLRIPTEKILLIGDYLFDIQAGNSAGTATALLVNHQTPNYADQATFVIHNLMEIPAILEL